MCLSSIDTDFICDAAKLISLGSLSDLSRRLESWKSEKIAWMMKHHDSPLSVIRHAMIYNERELPEYAHAFPDSKNLVSPAAHLIATKHYAFITEAQIPQKFISKKEMPFKYETLFVDMHHTAYDFHVSRRKLIENLIFNENRPYNDISFRRPDGKVLTLNIWYIFMLLDLWKCDELNFSCAADHMPLSYFSHGHDIAVLAPMRDIRDYNFYE